MTIKLENIGRTIKALRTSKKLSQISLTEAIGISNDYLSRIENGRLPTLKTLAKIADALETDITALLGEQRLLSSLQCQEMQAFEQSSINHVSQAIHEAFEHFIRKDTSFNGEKG